MDIKTISNLGKYPLNKEEHNRLCNTANSPPYIIDKENNFVAKPIKEKEQYYLLVFSTFFKVASKVVSKEDGTVSIKIVVNNGIDVREVTFNSDILTSFGIKELLRYGVRYNEQYIKYVLDYIIDSESKARTLYGYTKHGFIQDGNKLTFQSNILLGDSEQNKKYVYQGNMDLTPSGSLDIWSDMIKKEVISNVAMEFILFASFSSSLLALLNLNNDFGSIVINLANTSSKGKTTTAMLAASVYSNPMLNRGTAISYNGTENSIQEHIAQCNGLTVVLDEAAVCNTQNLQKMLYSISLGRSKMRLNGDSTQKEIKEFSSVIISTAEFNFIDDDSMDGVKARVFEVTDTLTTSAENSDNIKKAVINNYAVAGNMFIEHLISKGKDEVQAEYEKVRQNLIGKYKSAHAQNAKHDLTDRILSKLAIVLLSAISSNEIFEFKADIDTMISYLCKITDRIVDIPSPEDELLSVVYEDFYKNLRNYNCSCSLINEQFGEHSIPASCIGLIRNSKDDGFFEICVMQDHFKKLMSASKIADYKKRLKKLREKGVLVSQKDRQISEVSIVEAMPKSKAYIFKFSSGVCKASTKQNIFDADLLTDEELDKILLSDFEDIA